MKWLGSPSRAVHLEAAASGPARSSGSLERILPRRGGNAPASAGPGRGGLLGWSPGPPCTAACPPPGPRSSRLPAPERSHAVRDALAEGAQDAGPDPPAPEVSASGAVCKGSPRGCRASAAPRARARPMVTARGPAIGHVHNFAPPRAAAAPEAARDPGALDARAGRGIPGKRVLSLKLASSNPGLGGCG